MVSQVAININNRIKRARFCHRFIAILTLVIICQIILPSCEKEKEPAEETKNIFEDLPELYIQIMYHNRYGNICFIDSTVLFAPQTIYNNFDEYADTYTFDYLWEFGQGTIDTTRYPMHTFETPGWYDISLTILKNQDSIALDTNLKLLVYPQIIEITSATENGKFIYQSKNGNYSILYTFNTGTSVDDLYILQYNNNSIVTKNHLDLEWYAEVREPIVNSNDNMVLLNDTWFKEYSNIGSPINSSQVWGEYESIQNFNGGYLLTGCTEDEVKIKELNSSGVITSSNLYEMQIDDYTRIGTSQTIDNEIFLHYLKTDYINTTFLAEENCPSILQKINNECTILWQKEYGFSSSTRIKKLNDGYMIWGAIFYNVLGEKNLVFTKIDTDGNIIWTSIQKINSPYTQYKHAPGISIIENNDELLLFFDNMRCVKYDNSGNVIWDKYYGLELDVFNYALENAIGNYVLLGSRQFDNEFNGPTFDYDKRDLIIIEIDENGEPVY